MERKFYSQWSDDFPSWAEENNEPSMTVPDQSMTIQEIIARFTRSGVMPVAVHSDEGGQMADDPEFDPLEFDPQYWKDEAARLKAAQEGEVHEDASEPDKNTPAQEAE